MWKAYVKRVHVEEDYPVFRLIFEGIQNDTRGTRIATFVSPSKKLVTEDTILLTWDFNEYFILATRISSDTEDDEYIPPDETWVVYAPEKPAWEEEIALKRFKHEVEVELRRYLENNVLYKLVDVDTWEGGYFLGIEEDKGKVFDKEGVKALIETCVIEALEISLEMDWLIAEKIPDFEIFKKDNVLTISLSYSDQFEVTETLVFEVEK